MELLNWMLTVELPLRPIFAGGPGKGNCGPCLSAKNNLIDLDGAVFVAHASIQGYPLQRPPPAALHGPEGLSARRLQFLSGEGQFLLNQVALRHYLEYFAAKGTDVRWRASYKQCAETY